MLEASFWHIKCDAKSTEHTEPIKQRGQTAESETDKHARERPCVQKQTGGEEKSSHVAS